MMPAAPGTPLEVVEAEFVLEFVVGVLDPPATLRKPEEFLPGCRGRQVREEELRRLLGVGRPFGDQPARLERFFFGVSMAATNAYAEPGTERTPGSQGATKDVVATAVEAGHFHTLVKALEAAGLVDTLKGKGPFTVFAPSDEAFAKRCWAVATASGAGTPFSAREAGWSA